jgi:hypothetical protein
MALDPKAFWDPNQKTAVPYGVTPHGPIGPTITSDSLNDITLSAKDIRIELSDGTRVSIKEILDRLKALEETIGIERILLGDPDTK